MKNSRKEQKKSIHVYLDEKQYKFVKQCSVDYGMCLSKVCERLMFAQNTKYDPRYYNRIQ